MCPQFTFAVVHLELRQVVEPERYCLTLLTEDIEDSRSDMTKVGPIIRATQSVAEHRSISLPENTLRVLYRFRFDRQSYSNTP